MGKLNQGSERYNPKSRCSISKYMYSTVGKIAHPPQIWEKNFWKKKKIDQSFTLSPTIIVLNSESDILNFKWHTMVLVINCTGKKICGFKHIIKI